MNAISALWRSMRPRQWSKNTLLFAGLVFDGQLFHGDSLQRALAGFLLMSLLAGGIYILNDLVDRESDRRHPRKRLRPIAAGQMPLPLARLAAVLLPLLAIALAWLLTPKLALVFLAWIGVQLLYSFWLRAVALIDILAIVAGFVLRVAAGVILLDVRSFSPWLYVCTALLALFLAIGKRRQEFLHLAGTAAGLRASFRDYTLPLLDDMLRFAITSTFIAYVLYTVEAETIRVANTSLTLITIPFVLYGLLRYLFLIHTRNDGSAPDEILLRDRPLQLTIICWGFCFLLLIYLPGALT